MIDHLIDRSTTMPNLSDATSHPIQVHSLEEIAILVRSLRQNLGLSQEKFAAKLGVTLPTVSRWERQISTPSHLALAQIKALLEQMSISPQDSLRECGNALLAQYFPPSEI